MRSSTRSLLESTIEAMRALLLGFVSISCFFLSLPAAVAESSSATIAAGGGRGRSLLGFTETKGNASFQCSPSGPCIPCLYSEKNDEKYRCSETGYRLPLKCVEIQDKSKGETDNKKQRKVLGDSSTSEGGKQSYITFRSCVPMDGEEKLSVLGFEMIMVGMLLISGPVVYMRQRRNSIMPGAVRIPSNPPRF